MLWGQLFFYIILWPELRVPKLNVQRILIMFDLLIKAEKFFDSLVKLQQNASVAVLSNWSLNLLIAVGIKFRDVVGLCYYQAGTRIEALDANRRERKITCILKSIESINMKIFIIITKQHIAVHKILVFIRFFFEFLLKHARSIAVEIHDEYVETMSKVYTSYIQAYTKQLWKLQVMSTTFLLSNKRRFVLALTVLELKFNW